MRPLSSPFMASSSSLMLASMEVFSPASILSPSCSMDLRVAWIMPSA